MSTICRMACSWYCQDNVFQRVSTQYLIVEGGENLIINEPFAALGWNHFPNPRFLEIRACRTGRGPCEVIGLGSSGSHWLVLHSRCRRRSCVSILLEESFAASKAFLKILVWAPSFARWRWSTRSTGHIGLGERSQTRIVHLGQGQQMYLDTIRTWRVPITLDLAMLTQNTSEDARVLVCVVHLRRCGRMRIRGHAKTEVSVFGI